MPLKDDSVNVLLSLDAQKGQHFSEKFTKEDAQTFWYQDEKDIVRPALVVYTLCPEFLFTHIRKWPKFPLQHGYSLALVRQN